MSQQPSSGNPALQQGLLFGVVLGVLHAINGVIDTALQLTDISAILTIVLILGGLAAFFVAGFRAASVTGKVSTGLLAGLFTGLFSSLISGIVTIILSLIYIDRLREQAQAAFDKANTTGTQFTYTNTIVIGSVILSVVLLLLLSIVIGLAIGALGGAVGRGRAPVAPQQAYQESMYQPPMTGNPPAGYPPAGYPPTGTPPPPPQQGNWPPQQQ